MVRQQRDLERGAVAVVEGLDGHDVDAHLLAGDEREVRGRAAVAEQQEQVHNFAMRFYTRAWSFRA